MERLKTLCEKGFNLGTRGLLAAALAVTALGLAAAPASAATVVVDTTTDQALGSCSSSCSLRDAVFVANPGDTVSVTAGSYVLTLGQIQIAKDLIIAGAGAPTTIVDGNAADRIFDILSGTVEITDLTLTHGIIFDDGGAIKNQGFLTLLRCTVKENLGAQGGGIATFSGRLTIDQSTLSGNIAFFAGGGIAQLGPGGEATIVDSTLSGNSAGGGGGIAQLGTGSEATIDNSTLSGNTAQAFGGAWTCGIPPHPVLTLAIHNSTITGNVSSSGGGFDLQCSGLPEISLVNTIVAGNPGGDCSVFDTPLLSSHSLDSDGTCPLSGPGDLPATDPLLGPLADNGGPTATHALLTGSPALDAGDNATCLATDQRGVTRPQGPGCDIGAFEATPEDQIAALIAQINALVTGGALAPNKANPLLNKLEHVLDKLDKGQTNAACGQLGAFINQVNAYINNGTLTPAQGQALIDAAEAVRDNLGC